MTTERSDAALVRELAVNLAFFQRQHMYGRIHLAGALCGYSPQIFEGRPTGVEHTRECSPRCAAVRAVLGRAADYLGCSVDNLRNPPKRPVAAMSMEPLL